MMEIQIVDPSSVPDWDGLLLRSDDHDFFHTSAWARVLQKAYAFKPIYHVGIEDGKIAFLMPMMEIKSYLSGRRGVSLPFTDQCPPFYRDQDSLKGVLDDIMRCGERSRWRYIEWRDGQYFEDSVLAWDTFYVHEVDLLKTEQDLFSSLSDSNRRNIRKSQKEGVCITVSQSLDSVREFYRLNLITRKRHGLPPQPFTFFRHIFEHIISKGNGHVVLASYEDQTVAAAMFFHFGKKAIYKFGASNMQIQHVRPNNLVMWEALKWYHDRGFHTMNLGRSELSNPGLRRYKRTWGGREAQIKYFRYDLGKRVFLHKDADRMADVGKIFMKIPMPILRILGFLFYRHAG